MSSHDDYDGPSKSQVKREMDALQELGEELIALSVDQLKRFDLPETLFEAVRAAQKISSHGAIRRQRQYVGKLMRQIDPEPIRQRLAALKGESDAYNAWLHRLERWRDRLLQDELVLADLMDECPHLDRQIMHQAIRNARKEREQNKPPKAYRQIFQLLKEALPAPDQTTAPHADEDHDE